MSDFFSFASPKKLWNRVSPNGARRLFGNSGDHEDDEVVAEDTTDEVVDEDIDDEVVAEDIDDEVVAPQDIQETTDEARIRENVLTVIETALGCHHYNTSDMREAIYISKQTQYSRLRANAIMIGVLVSDKTGKSFPSSLSALLVEQEVKDQFELTSRNKLKKHVKALGLVTAWVSFEKKLENVTVFERTSEETALRYLSTYHHLITWYTKCGFFTNVIIINRKKRIDGEVDEFSFLKPNEDVAIWRRALDAELRRMDKFLQDLLRTKPVREMIGGEKAFTDHLNHNYAKMVAQKEGEEATTRSGILVVGMSNFRSDITINRIRLMENSTGTPSQSTTNVFTLSSQAGPEGNQYAGCKQLKKNNVYLKWDSPYLLATIVHKFKNVKFDKIYLDFSISPAMRVLHEKTLIAFFETTIPLLKESGLLSEVCKVVVPFNEFTLAHLHKSWAVLKRSVGATFLSDINGSEWYQKTNVPTNVTDKRVIGSDKIKLGGEINAAIEAEKDRMEKGNNRKRKKNPLPCRSALLVHLTEVLGKWNRYTDADVKKLHWIQLQVLPTNVSSGRIDWPPRDNSNDVPGVVAAGHNTLPDMQLQCNVASLREFENYYDGNFTGEPPKITVSFSDNSSAILRGITTYNNHTIKGKVDSDLSDTAHTGQENERYEDDRYEDDSEASSHG